jgi:hypothetical protein
MIIDALSSGDLQSDIFYMADIILLLGNETPLPHMVLSLLPSQIIAVVLRWACCNILTPQLTEHLEKAASLY